MLVLITGSTDGIGRQTARELARRGASVLLHGRDPARLAEVQREISASSPGPPPVCADLSSLAEVRRMAAEVEAQPIDVLIHNAGVFMNERRLTADGFETTFAVNHLAPFLLTHLLLPKLRQRSGARVINVSSIAHGSARLDLDDLQLEKRFDGYRAYANSKLANVLFTVELARRVPELVVHALHPGVVSTKLLREGFSMNGPDSLERGAATSVHLALDPGPGTSSGRYFVYGKEQTPSAAARDPALARSLYRRSCELAGIPEA